MALAIVSGAFVVLSLASRPSIPIDYLTPEDR
jgi:hypothetical protein